MLKTIRWDFPLKQTHCGIMTGNARNGIFVWGEGNTLIITVGRADLWDHRGGMEWTPEQNLRNIRNAVETGNKELLTKIFSCKKQKDESEPPRPTIMPFGRIEIIVPEGSVLKSGSLEFQTGEILISYSRNIKKFGMRILHSMKEDVFVIESEETEKIEIKESPSWNLLEDYYRSKGFKEPEYFKAPHQGWIQNFPCDQAAGLALKKNDRHIWAATGRGASLNKELKELIDRKITEGIVHFSSEIKNYWKEYWNGIPEINIPNKTLTELYYYGLFKFACMTDENGVAAGLQGPWIEDFQIPPWSADYHFNINVQMCYSPAYKSGKLKNLLPLFRMVFSWKEQLRKNAEYFVGIKDGYMMPHAVDDRCTCMGSFWTGTVDHACTAWIADMMYQYYTYSGDLDFLRDSAYEFMNGAMKVYIAMLEKKDGQYLLPLSVSPEYRGAEMNAWGRNASFQLAAIHKLGENILASADILRLEANAEIKEVLKKLPKASLFGDAGKERIGLWNGTDLEESHRHHSHLAGITPFDTIDLKDPEWAAIVERSIQHWTRLGMGQWTGWCIPWASMIHSRIHNGQMAELLIEIYAKIFSNEGRGSLHDPAFPGLSAMGWRAGREVMQMDAAMGSINAIQDMMVHSQRGILHVGSGFSPRWKKASFKKLFCEGGFLLSASAERGLINKLEIKATRDGEIQIQNPFTRKNGDENYQELIKLEMKAGEKIVLRP